MSEAPPVELLFFDLLSTLQISDLVGGRVYPVKLPQDCQFPAISFVDITQDTITSHSGASGLGRRVFQFDVWSKHYAEMVDISKFAHKKLHGYKEYDGIVLGDIQTILFQDGSTVTLYQDDVHIYHRVMDFAVWHREGDINQINPNLFWPRFNPSAFWPTSSSPFWI